MKYVTGRTADAYPVAAGFGLKLALLLVVYIVQLVAFGHPTSFFALAGSSGALCFAVALWKGERPFGPLPTYWDETPWFGLVACLA
jgi:hypothetical protein